MMPVFDLTADQLKALKTLMWLYDPSEASRRTGRSTVLSLGFLYQMVQNHGQWIKIQDHHSSRMADERMGGVVLSMATKAGVRTDDIERRWSHGLEMRLKRHHHTISVAAWEAITVFGTLDALPGVEGPPDPDLTETTLWDHVTDEDSGI